MWFIFWKEGVIGIYLYFLKEYFSLEVTLVAVTEKDAGVDDLV